jgi:hypothetical protein
VLAQQPHCPGLRVLVVPDRHRAILLFGEALPVTMGHIDDWIARNRVLATA